MADKRQDIVLRFGIVYFIILILFSLVIYKIVVIQFFEKKEWMAVASKNNNKSDINVNPNRGNIFACDGRLMASSIPMYNIYMDTRVPALHNDTNKLFREKIDSVSLSLANYFKDKSKSEYKSMITKAFREGKSELLLYPDRISYAQLKDIRKMPLFCLGKYKSGLITKEYLRREKPFGSLASRTIGDIYLDETSGGKNGLEMFFNDQLKGKPGISVRQKIANRYEETIQVEPVDGLDLVTTIDLNLQDIAESALKDSLKSFNAVSGYAILMEVKSGEVKAIVNLQINKDSTYSENQNGAVSDLVEPGSTFKIASLMAVIDDGKAKITDVIHTGTGHFDFYGEDMVDHNAAKGGFGDITLAEAIHGSSNIGVSRVIESAYGQNPSEFVDKLYTMGLNEKMDLEIPGNAGPKIKHPNDKSSDWSKTSLPWMSIGYETQIPPIYTLAFYNAIANNGKLIRPFFVKSILKNGQELKKFETETIRESICKPSTLSIVKETLLGVIEGEKGTAHNVHSKFVRIAGKTGTAQISKGKIGYKSGGKTHQVSFCGYFPANNPIYTCIVVIREPRKGHPSGGRMAGSVFKTIAEQTMALKSNLNPDGYIKDTSLIFKHLPSIKLGYFSSIETIANDLKLPLTGQKNKWVSVSSNENALNTEQFLVYKNKMPNLKGMGAKDALFLVTQLGLKAQITGRGKVISQNLKPGTTPKHGDIIKLNFE